MAVLAPLTAQAQSFNLAIPALPLADALRLVAQATHQNILFAPDVVAGLTSKPLSGAMSARDAVARLLDGTRLEVRADGNGLIVRPAPNEPATAPAPAPGAAPGAATAVREPTAEPKAESPPLGPASLRTEEVVVTGSRVIANGNDMPTPVTTVSPQELMQTTPATVMDGLQALPVFSGGRSPLTNPGNSSQNNASHQLNLRNVGITRTLVLYDGRRIAPTAPTGEVDTDIIPQMLLQRIDVVTGGASAVYGSDAVTGVVNFVTDTHFNGFKATAQAGLSEYGDGMERRFGLAGGTDVLSGRGHIEGSYEWYGNDGIAGADKLQRPWAAKVISVQGGGTAANPYHITFDTRLSSTSFGGVIRSGPLTDQEFRQNGVLSPFVHGGPTGSNGVESGGDGGYYYQASLEALAASNQLYGRFDYDLSDSVNFYLEAAGTKIHNENNHQTNEFRNITLGATNAFLAPAYQQAMAGSQSLTFSKMMTDAPPLQPDSWTTSALVEAGLTGNFAGFRWDLSYVHNGNEQFTRNNANLNLAKAYAALDAVEDPATGQAVCRVSLTNPGLYPGCVPLNLFGPSSESQAALDYILAVTEYHAHTDMDDVGGSISGSPFASWAGPARLALSAEWRRLTFNLDSNAEPTAHLDCTGLRFNCAPNSLTYISNILADAHDQSQRVTEAALEMDLPLLKDLPFAKAADLSGAIRTTNYDTSGSVTTWKLGAEWHVDDELSFRATRSLDIRAPNLSELYAPQLINPAGVTDIHTQTAGQAFFITNSNPHLVPERANTGTAGVIWRPASLGNFSLALDWYRIKIGNAITTIQGQSATIQNICEASNGASPYCAYIQRPLAFSDRSPANFAGAFLSQPQNAQLVLTEGVDIEANYQADLGPGHFSLRALASYQPQLKTVQFPGAPVLQGANVAGSPAFRSAWFAKYSWGGISIDLLEKFHLGTKWNPDRSLIYAEPGLPAAFYTNISVTYGWQRTQLFLTIENLFDKQPTPYGTSGGASGVPGLFGGFVPGDDAIGRYYTIGFRFGL